MRELGDCVELVRGTTYKSALLGQPGPWLLGLSSIQRDGGFRNDALRSYGGESPEKLILRPGDLFVSLKDVTQSGDLLGSVARVPKALGLGRLTQDTVKLKPKPKAPPNEFLYWLLRTPQYREYCRARAIGTTNLSLSREDFLAFPVPAPTRERMLLIDLLERLEDKIDVNRRMNQTLEAIAQALFRAWFTEEATREAGSQTVPLSEAADLNPSSQIERNEAPYVEMANLPTVGHRPAGWPLRSVGSGARFKNGDTLLARITPCLENGKTAYVDFLREGEVAWGSTEYIVIRPKPPLCSQWGYLLARDQAFRDFAAQKMEGTTGRQRVSAAALGTYPVVIPPTDVCARFEKMVAPLFERMGAACSESQTLAALRDLLLPKLLSGELTPG